MAAIIIACVLAGVSVAAFVVLWFWVVRRELRAKQKAVSAAKSQLIASKQGYLRARDGLQEPHAREIMERSQSIYQQAVQLYGETLHKPWNRVPAFFFGFCLEKEINQTG